MRSLGELMELLKRTQKDWSITSFGAAHKCRIGDRTHWGEPVEQAIHRALVAAKVIEEEAK